jgi:hypothetical protein
MGVFPPGGPAASPACHDPLCQTHEIFVPIGTGAGAPPIKFHLRFVPAAGEAAGPSIVPATWDINA